MRIIGKTPTGRATVERLKLNRLGVVNLRRALFATDEHPPPIVAASLKEKYSEEG